MLLHPLLTCIDSDENSDVILRSVPPFVTYLFSLVSFKNFSLSLFFSNLIMISLGAIFFWFLVLVLWFLF